MNDTNRPVKTNDAANNVDASFLSLASLRAAHSDLLKRHREGGDAPEFLAEVEEFVRRGRATGTLLDDEDDRWASQGLLDYWATMLDRAEREPPDATLAEFDPLLAPELDDTLCPYLGLDAFREDNHGVFFGRQRLIGEMVGQLEKARLLAVIGPSGSGKSSLVMAGLLPALKSGAVSDSQDWRYYPPMVPGSNPLANLARLLRPSGVNAWEWVQREVELLHQDSGHLAQLIAELGDPDRPVVLVIDQFEEVFTLCDDDQVRQAFVDNLLGLIQPPNARHTIVLTIRVDFEPYIARLPSLQPLFERAQMRVPPLSAGELRAAIEEPAKLVGLKFEEGVVDALLQDILGEPAALPLLQFSLLKLWENRERNRVTWEAYRRMGNGRQALARSADEFYDGLIFEEQITAKRIMLRMVRPGEGLEVTSNRVQRETLHQAGEARDRVERVLDKLVQARLIRLTKGDTPADDQVEVAHEALVRNWPRLVDWLEDEREAMRRRLRLTSAAEQWKAMGRDSEALWRGSLLTEALRYQDLNELETEFIQDSQVAVEQAEREKEAARQRELEQARALAAEQQRRAEQQARSARRLSWLAVAFAAVFLLAIGAAVNAVLQGQKAIELKAVAEARRLEAVTAQAAAVAEATRAIDAEQTAKAESTRAIDAEQTAKAESTRAIAAEKTAEARRVEEENARATAVAVADAHAAEVVVRKTAEAEAISAQATAEALRVNAVAARIEAEKERDRAEQQLRLANARGLAAAAIENLDTDPERSILLALQAVSTTYSEDKTVTNEAQDALHRAVQASRIQLTLSDHKDRVYSVAFSPDGTRLATASGDRVVKIWDAVSGTELLTLYGHKGTVWSVTFSPDGKRLATASEDGTAKVWDAVSGEELLTLSGHNGTVWSVAFSQDGTRLATAGKDKKAKVWSLAPSSAGDVYSGKELFTLSGHTDMVWDVAFSPDGEYLATASGDKTAKVWSIPASEYNPDQVTASSQELLTLSGHSDAVRGVAFSPDGKRLVTASVDLTAKVWLLSFDPVENTASGRELFTLSGHTNAIIDIDFHETLLATASTDRTAKVWDATTGEALLTLSGHTEGLFGVAFSPNGKRLATASADRTARVWNISASQELLTLSEHADSVMSVAFSPDGQRLATAGTDRTGKVWSLPSWEASAAGDVTLGKELLTLSGHTDWVLSIAFSPDGTRLATASGDKTARVWNADSGQQLITLYGHLGTVRDVAFSPEGTHLATASSDGSAKVWSLAPGSAGDELLSLPGHINGATSVAFSPDGTYLATASGDRKARIWSADSGKELLALSGHSDWVIGLAFSPDSTRLATASRDGTIKIWSVASGEELLTLIGHTDVVVAVAFNSDGTRLASASYDKTAKVWSLASSSAGDAITGEALLTLYGHTDAVLDVAFSPGCVSPPEAPAERCGTRLATASRDGTARVYVLDMEELVTLACSRVTRDLSQAEWETYLGTDVPYRQTCPD